MTSTNERLKLFWDQDSHAASDPVEAAAWRAAIGRFLPPAPAAVLDAGAGTGSMTLLAAELGYTMTALDLSSGMLKRLQEKAAERGCPVKVVNAPAGQPPPGPFDAVMARHLIWTLPDPVATLAAWRPVAKRLVLFEGEWGVKTQADKVRSSAARIARKALQIGHDHHRHYEPELSDALPFSRGTSADGILEACDAAGWKRLTIERLSDVEWARDRLRHAILRPLEGVPQFAVTGERGEGD